MTGLDNSTSTIHVTIAPHPMRHAPLQDVLLAKVRAGDFVNDHAGARGEAEVGNEGCTNGGIASYSFFAAGGEHETTLNLSHE